MFIQKNKARTLLQYFSLLSLLGFSTFSFAMDAQKEEASPLGGIASSDKTFNLSTEETSLKDSNRMHLEDFIEKVRQAENAASLIDIVCKPGLCLGQDTQKILCIEALKAYGKHACPFFVPLGKQIRAAYKAAEKEIPDRNKSEECEARAIEILEQNHALITVKIFTTKLVEGKQKPITLFLLPKTSDA